MIQYIADAPLWRYCTFLTGGPARRLGIAYNAHDLAQAAINGALVLGRGSNVLIGDGGYDGDVVINRAERYEISGDRCTCDSGVPVSVLARAYAEAGRAGLAWAYGMPGSAGGAAVGNAGAFGGCMADAVQSVTVLVNGRCQTLSAEECGFVYRGSALKGTVLSLTLKAPAGDKDAERARGRENLLLRRQTQPQGASAGSVFKGTEQGAAGKWIEKAGLKGLTAGGAEISCKHANFIVNRGGATSGDILQLMNTAQAVVFDRFGIRLTREIKLLGDFFG
ncbi:MAG: UDP-N-acetylmuramate dehydrogenase [Clostridia bacterium]|nr:UDP-N-acetylmuramate dehydrogenase [Clostridia bacterium]